MGRIGNHAGRVTTRLRRTFLAIFAVLIAVPIGTYIMAHVVGTSLSKLTDTSIPALKQSNVISRELTNLVALSSSLGAQDTPEDLAITRATLADTLVRLDKISDELQGAADDSSVRTRIKREVARIDQKAQDLGDLRLAILNAEQTISIGMPAVADKIIHIEEIAETALVEKITDLEQFTGREPNSFSESESPSLKAELKSKISSITALTSLTFLLEDLAFNANHLQNPVSSDSTLVTLAHIKFLIRSVVSSVANLDEGQYRTDIARITRELYSAFFDKGGIPAAIITLRDDRKKFEEIRREQVQLVTSTLDFAASVVAQTELNTVEASDRITSTIDRARLITLALGTLAGVIILWLWYSIVEQQFNRRITLLTDSALALAEGDLDLDIDIGGVDEISSVANALHVFKQNARELKSKSAENDAIRNRLEAVLNTATSGILALNQDGNVTMINRAAREMLHMPSIQTPFEWPVTLSFLDHEELAPLDASADPIRRALSGHHLRGEINLLDFKDHENEAARYVRVSSGAIDDPSLKLRTVVVLDDVTEDELRRQQLERSSRLDALGQLTGGIAHDFNNLLATVLYALDLTTKEPLSPKAARLTGVARDTVQRGAELTKRLLAFAKQQPGQASSQSVREAFEGLNQLTASTIGGGISLEFENMDEDLWIYCDPAQFENAVLNLILNSRDSILQNDQGSTIKVQARTIEELPTVSGDLAENTYEALSLRSARQQDRDRDDGRTLRYVEISVSDDGPGMKPEVLRRAVDPFFTTKENNSGTGLGLSMVYGFVQQADGELRIYSDEGRGTTIRMLLPRGTAVGSREKAMDRAIIEKGQGERIFLVEDEESQLMLLEEVLQSLGYQTVTATSGYTALEMFVEGVEFDLLLTDVVMPGGVGGFELARQVRATRPDVPIIYMSGYTGFSTEEMGSVVATLVAKPCQPAELAKEIREELARTTV